MKKALVDKLRCPVSGEKLQLHSLHEDGDKVQQGILRTLSNGHEYRIVDGIIELLPPLDQQTQRERDERDSWEFDLSEERQRPYLNDDPFQPWRWPSRAANAEQAFSLLNWQNLSVLDVGAGRGWSSRMISERGGQVIALDISTNSLKVAKVHLDNNRGLYFERIAATMSRLPFENALFDVVFTSASLHHANDVHSALREFSRVLKPGGRLILSSEPVLGFLKAGQKFGAAAIEAGMNEHIYPLHSYIKFVRQVRLKPKILFPADLQRQLEGAIVPPTPMIHQMRRLYHWLPKQFWNLALYPAHWLIGLTLLLIATKSDKSES